jgi:hypothetical protein
MQKPYHNNDISNIKLIVHVLNSINGSFSYNAEAYEIIISCCNINDSQNKQINEKIDTLLKTFVTIVSDKTFDLNNLFKSVQSNDAGVAITIKFQNASNAFFTILRKCIIPIQEQKTKTIDPSSHAINKQNEDFSITMFNTNRISLFDNRPRLIKELDTLIEIFSSPNSSQM